MVNQAAIDNKSHSTQLKELLSMPFKQQSASTHNSSAGPKQFLPKLLRWFLIGLTLLLALPLVFTGQIISFLCMVAAIAILLPPFDAWFRAKLPLLQNGFVKAVLWIALFLMAMSLVGQSNAVLRDVKLCSRLEAGICQTDVDAFVKNTQTLYLTSTVRNIADGTPFQVVLNYRPAPQEVQPVASQVLTAKIKENQLFLELKSKKLSIGTYELSVTAQTKNAIKKTKTFTVWDDQKSLETSQGDTWPMVDITFSKLNLCSNVTNLEDSENTVINGIKFRDRTAVNNPYQPICSTDSKTIKSNVKTLHFWLDVDSRLVEPIKIEIIWRYLKNPNKPFVVSQSVKSLSANTAGLNYTLDTKNGLPPGNYELVLVPNVKKAIPLYRKFTIK